MTATDWKDEARSLRDAGLSEREIAESVGKAPSTVHEALKGYEPNSNGHGKVSKEQATEPAAAAGLTQDELDAEPSRTPRSDAIDEQAGPGEARTPLPGQRTIDGQEVQVPIEELRVDGTTQLGLIDFGGKRPQSASLRLVGGKVLLADGRAFSKGDVIHGSFTAVVNEVGAKDSHDPKTGIVVSAEQKHSARITDLQVGS
jgi:hypothetical protein